ncbi:MAG: peptidylprolyl isomerase [Sphingomonas sp.]|nr:peptidylprolyl isomerase [Sphingomonas sp.]
MRALFLLAGAVMVIGAGPPKRVTPTEIVAAAPPAAWRAIPADDLLVMDLKAGGRVVVQLAPAFAPVHVGNIRNLATAGYWEGATIYRVQDNYVTQWGNNESEKPWPKGVVAKPPAEYSRGLRGLTIKPLGSPDPYAPAAGFANGWPVAYSPSAGWATLAHCYGTVGVGRGMNPDTGTGGELYAVIGQATRHMDRNLAIVGRVIEGIERLSALPRGTETLGFYKEPSSGVLFRSIRLASQMPAPDRPAFEVMDTNSVSFARYLRVRANRFDDFYRHPAGGVDLCNVQVPVRRKG